MSEDRIKELQDFTLDFQEQLREAKELYQQKRDKSKSLEPKYLKTENVKTKLHIDKNKEDKKKLNRIKKIGKIKMNQHWVPNCLFGKSMDKFKKLTHQHFPTSWELVNKNIILNYLQARVPLIKRSYEKESNFLNKKDFICRNLYGENFDKNPYDNEYTNLSKAEKGLSADGKRMIRKFIIQNKKMEEKLKKEEEILKEKFYQNNKSKEKRSKSFWKSGLHVMENFGPFLIDKVHKFKVKPIITYERPPFKRPKEDGDYFDKDLHLI